MIRRRTGSPGATFDRLGIGERASVGQKGVIFDIIKIRVFDVPPAHLHREFLVGPLMAWPWPPYPSRRPF